jgi:hypothetical protein
MFYEPWTEIGRRAADKRLDFLAEIKQPCEIEKHNKTRTNKQNRALHLWFNQVADLLNNKGITFESIAGLEAPFTGEYIKVNWFKPIVLAMFEKNTTTKLNTTEINQVFDVVSKHISEMTGEFIEFPSFETLMKKNEKAR